MSSQCHLTSSSRYLPPGQRPNTCHTIFITLHWIQTNPIFHWSRQHFSANIESSGRTLLQIPCCLILMPFYLHDWLFLIPRFLAEEKWCKWLVSVWMWWANERRKSHESWQWIVGAPAAVLLPILGPIYQMSISHSHNNAYDLLSGLKMLNYKHVYHLILGC